MYKKYITILAFLTFSVTAFAQPVGGADYATMIKVADQLSANQDYYNALKWYKKAYDESQDRDLLILMGDMSYSLRDYRKAASNYKRLLKRDKDNKFVEKRYYYARSLKMNGKYKDAIKQFKKYLELSTNEEMKALAKLEIEGAELAMTLPDNNRGVKLKNMGNKINTKLSQYSPIATSDAQTLYYAGFAPDAKDVIEVSEKNDDYHVRLYKVERNKEGNWGAPKQLGDKINRPGTHTVNATLSADGQTMFFTRSELQGNKLGKSVIYMSNKKGGEWEGPEAVQGLSEEAIATHPAMGELYGKEVMFFVSDMEGGYGGLDVYYATHKGGGVFADPVNLGPSINTSSNEATPYYYDGVLYFSSEGYPSLGGYDVYYSVWDGANWEAPKNMGKVFNSPVDDTYFTMADEGHTGFLASNRVGGKSAHGKTCCDDLYTFDIPHVYADIIVSLYDLNNEAILGGGVKLQLIEQGAAEASTRVNKKSEKFEFGLDLQKEYMVVASAPGYFPDSVEINTLKIRETTTLKHKFNLTPKPEIITITKKEPIVLDNILYDYNSANIKPESEPDLNFVLGLMNEYPEMKVEMGAHTDFRGENDYNADLSQRRAESAKQWLIDKGVKAKRVRARGYGESKPQTVTEKMATKYDFLKEGDVLTEEYINALELEEEKEIAHSINRRTEFKIVSGPTEIIFETKKQKNYDGSEIDLGTEKKVNQIEEEGSNRKSNIEKKK